MKKFFVLIFFLSIFITNYHLAFAAETGTNVPFNTTRKIITETIVVQDYTSKGYDIQPDELIYGNKTYVALLSKSNQKSIFYSSDLKHWQRVALTLPDGVENKIMFIEGKFYIFACTDDPLYFDKCTNITLYVSTDCRSWSKQPFQLPVEAVYQKSVGYDNGQYYCVDFKLQLYYHSQDGLKWISSATNLRPDSNVIYEYGTEYTDAAFGNGASVISMNSLLHVSWDDSNWHLVGSKYHTPFSLPLADMGGGMVQNCDFTHLAFGNDVFVAAPDNSKSLYVSINNGANWVGVIPDTYQFQGSSIYPIDQGYRDLIFNKDAFYLLQNNGSILKSYDGFEWFEIRKSPQEEWYGRIAVVNSKVVLLTETQSGKLSSITETDELVFQKEAEVLAKWGLLKGSSDGFALDRIPTRAEAAVMLVRLLGKEKEAQLSPKSHPFTDVPAWCDAYVGYLFQNGLISGVGNGLYGSTSLVDAKAYMTMMLRILGYNDSNGDFSWKEAIIKASELDIIDWSEQNMLSTEPFTRGLMVHLSKITLGTNLKNSDTDLFTHLESNGIFGQNTSANWQYGAIHLVEKKAIVSSLSSNEISYLQTLPYKFGTQVKCGSLMRTDPVKAHKILSVFNDCYKYTDRESYMTNESLVYVTANGDFGIRGVYRITYSAGFIMEVPMDVIIRNHVNHDGLEFPEGVANHALVAPKFFY